MNLEVVREACLKSATTETKLSLSCFLLLKKKGYYELRRNLYLKHNIMQSFHTTHFSHADTHTFLSLYLWELLTTFIPLPPNSNLNFHLHNLTSFMPNLNVTLMHTQTLSTYLCRHRKWFMKSTTSNSLSSEASLPCPSTGNTIKGHPC